MNLFFTLSSLSSNFALTLGYLNPTFKQPRPRAGLELGASELQVQRSSHLATLPPHYTNDEEEIKITTLPIVFRIRQAATQNNMCPKTQMGIHLYDLG